MVRSFRYRLYPTRTQATVLTLWLNFTRELYNSALQEKRDAWKKQHKGVSLYDQMKQLPGVREVRPEFLAVPTIVLRGTLRRLDRAFAAFFCRCKAGEKPGYPRFKSARRWNSILIDDLGRKCPIVAGGKRVKLPFGGKVRIKLHRPMEGTPKAMRLKFDGDGHWYVSFQCVDVPARPLPPTGQDVGIDLGLTHFAATSDGELFENPRPLKAAQLKLTRAQRIVSKRKRGSNRRRKAVKLLAKQHFHVAQVRRQHHIDVACSLVARYDVIYFEELNIKGLAAGMLAGPVNDAAWSGFLHWLSCKAEGAGREAIGVNPRGTSQECPECGQVRAKTLAERVHRCDCGCVLDRDVAAAKIIKARGRRVRPGALGYETPMTREEVF